MSKCYKFFDWLTLARSSPQTHGGQEPEEWKTGGRVGAEWGGRMGRGVEGGMGGGGGLGGWGEDKGVKGDT